MKYVFLFLWPPLIFSANLATFLILNGYMFGSIIPINVFGLANHLCPNSKVASLANISISHSTHELKIKILQINVIMQDFVFIGKTILCIAPNQSFLVAAQLFVKQ